jgi:steroid delta-isomerase-like uncharacterized protein
MSAEGNKTLVRRLYDEAINSGNFNIVQEAIANNYVYHSPGVPEFRGPDGCKELITMYRTAFSDLHLEVDELIAEGDTVVVRWTARGTHDGEFMGIPATGKRATVTGVGISHFSDGKVTEDWEVMDTFGMMQQLGVTPAPELAAAR